MRNGRPIRQLEGLTSGRLTVIGLSKVKDSISWWWCRCLCGSITLVRCGHLTTGQIRSCGCLTAEARLRNGKLRGGWNKSHGSILNQEYDSWRGMKGRCYNKNNHKYLRYGGRGIIVCDRWLGLRGFENFLADMGRKPGPEYSIDRYPNNDGNYEPGNCRWATQKQQQNNRSNNISKL